MKAVMLSLRPQWCEKIFNGSKTIEVRKSRPSIPTPFKVYVYETKGKTKYWSQPMPIPYTEGRGKVIGSFVCDRIEEIKAANAIQAYYNNREETCVSDTDLRLYLGENTGYAWHISDLKIYDKPKELGEFSYPAEHNFTKRAIKESREMGFICHGVYITRPPQSWCYVEELG